MEKGHQIGKGKTAEIYSWGSDRILKLYFKSRPLSEAENEAKIQKVVYNFGIPTPAIQGIVQVDDRTGIIMERINGPTMLEVLARQPWRIIELAHLLARLHIELHAHRLTELESARLQLWAAIARAKPISLAFKQSLMRTLVDLPDSESICHKDFHPENVIMSARGPVIIDWTDAGKGNPLLDVARTWLLINHSYLELSLPWHIVMTPIRRLFFTFYFQYYGQSHPVNKEQFQICRRLIAAARLSEGYAREQRRLLSFLKIPAETGVTSNTAAF